MTAYLLCPQKSAPDRCHHNAQDIMLNFNGLILADAWGAYDKVEGTVHAHDWARVRRKFVDVVNGAPKGTDLKNSLSSKIISLISKLFRYDKVLKPEKMSYDEIAENRKRREKLVVDEIFDTLKRDQDRIPKLSQLHKAVMYALDHEEGLCRYLDDGRIEMTSNIIEREMKAFGIARKNFLFMNTVNGAQASVHIFSVLRTTAMNHLDLERYMTCLISKLPLIDIDDENQIEELMPWSGSLPDNLKRRKK